MCGSRESRVPETLLRVEEDAAAASAGKTKYVFKSYDVSPGSKPLVLLEENR